MDDQMATNGRVTNQDIDRRVGRLEEVQGQHGDRLHELGNEVNVVKLQVEHSQALMKSKFEQLIAAHSTTDSKVDRVIDRLDKETAGFHELDASPIGRTVKQQLQSLEHGREQNAARIKKVEDRILQVAAVLAFIGFLMPLVAPLLAGWIGLPTQ